MKKIKFDNKYKQIAILVFLIIIGSITFEKVIGNISGVFLNISTGFNFIIKLLRPFFIGFCIAYILNPGVRRVETILRDNAKLKIKDKRYRALSVLIVYMFAIICIAVIILAILPNIVTSLNSFVLTLPDNINNFQKEVSEAYISNNEFFTEVTDMFNRYGVNNFTNNDILSALLLPIQSILNNLPDLASKILQGTLNFAGMILNIILGFVISIYMINDKEYFGNIILKFLNALFKKNFVKQTVSIAKLSNSTFEKFIIGKSIDSFIIGILFFIVCTFLNIDYVILLAVIVGVTNMIPYFGPFIGAVPVLIIVALSSISSVIPVGITILILQQFDGVILGPKILGDSIGLKPISIILSIMIGGGILGPIGMFIGAPIFAVISTMVSEIISRLEKKKEKEII